jgi:hypothetical protein
MKLDKLNDQKLFANLHILYDDLINFLESKSQVVEIKHMEDPVIGMMEHIVENADTLFLYQTQQIHGAYIEHHVNYLKEQVRITRNEICHLYSKLKASIELGVIQSPLKYSGAGVCYRAIYDFQHLLHVEMYKSQ